MSTSVRIGTDTKRRIEQLADLEGITQREVINRALAFYQLTLLRTHMEQKDFWTPEMIEAFAKARDWLDRLDKRKLKELAKKKGEKP